MANDLTGKVWIIDTAATISNYPVVIEKMVYKPAATANDLTITDFYGGRIWDVDALAAAPAGNEFFDQGEAIRFIGFIVTVIDGGTLEVTVR